jgi:hypothetical protein
MAKLHPKHPTYAEKGEIQLTLVPLQTLGQRKEMGKDRSPWEMHLFLLLFMTSIRFARFPQGFGAAVHRFWGGKPWESKETRE